MLRKLRPRSAYDVMAAIAFFIAVAGGTAWAADTIGSDDVIDNSLTGADIKGKPSPGFVDGTLESADVRNKSLLSSDVATNTLTAGELAPNSASVSEIKNEAVDANKVKDLSLNDEDIGQGTFVSFNGNIGPVPAHHCVDRQVDGVNARGDHALLTPDFNGATGELSYTVLHSSETGPNEGYVVIRVCNPTAVEHDGSTRFNLLIIDAQ